MNAAWVVMDLFRPTVMLTVIMSCRLILNLRSMSSRGDNSTPNKSGSEVPSSRHPMLRRGNTRENPPSSFKREKEVPFLPMTIDIRQEPTLLNPPSTAHSRNGLTYPYAVHQSTPPPWQPVDSSQQFSRPPRMPTAKGLYDPIIAL